MDMASSTEHKTVVPNEHLHVDFITSHWQIYRNKDKRKKSRASQ